MRGNSVSRFASLLAVPVSNVAPPTGESQQISGPRNQRMRWSVGASCSSPAPSVRDRVVPCRIGPRFLHLPGSSVARLSDSGSTSATCASGWGSRRGCQSCRCAKLASSFSSTRQRLHDLRALHLPGVVFVVRSTTAAQRSATEGRRCSGKQDGRSRAGTACPQRSVVASRGSSGRGLGHNQER